MSPALVLDASVAVKWVVAETGSDQAVALRKSYNFVAPDLLTAECANILWKKVQRGELDGDSARLAARLLTRSGVRLIPSHGYLERALDLALLLDHPAYDCLYLALLIGQPDWQFVTADERLLKVLRARGPTNLSGRSHSLQDMGGAVV